MYCRYSGHIPKSADVYGMPIIQAEEFQDLYGPAPVCKYKVSIKDGPHLGHDVAEHAAYRRSHSFSNEGLRRRYAEAIAYIATKSTTQECLINLIKSKMSDRVNSYAQQQIRTRKIFEYFDFDENGSLDEFEFKKFLELLNCFFSEKQSLAIFAYFDTEFEGFISWERFSSVAMVKISNNFLT